jgi:hypothetical protein
VKKNEITPVRVFGPRVECVCLTLPVSKNDLERFTKNSFRHLTRGKKP